MRRTASTTIVLALVASAVAALSACGESDAELLPGETAREITANLNSVQQLADEGDCSGAEAAAQQVSEQVEALGGVDPKLKDALRDGAERLNEVVAECEETSEETVPPEETTEEPEEGEKQREKEERKAEKERDKESGKPKDEPETEPEPELPPQAEGEGKGPSGEGGDDGDDGEAEAPSGGVGAGTPVGEDD
jgi:hypothetical protein